MTISLAAARKLCTGRELELVEASRTSAMKEITPARLRQKVQRARALRDKYRDLAKRQRLQARGKARPSGRRAAQGNENTVRKAQLFDEVLGRFEARLEKVQAAGTGGASRSSKRDAGGAAAKRKGAVKSAKPAKSARKTSAKSAKSARNTTEKSTRPMKEPRTPGAAALKGARSRPGRADAANKGSGRSKHAHTKSANRRSQQRRDRS
jgi:hypothetical protein